MSTALFALAISVPARIAELTILVEHASSHETKNEPIYNAICRSTCVLMASHIEGFLKELTRSIVDDLNANFEVFSKMPIVLQRTFCEKIAYYENVPQNEIDERIIQLIAFFQQNSIPINMRAFSYKESSNRNATSDYITKSLGKMGVPNVIGAISNNKYESIFENDRQKSYYISKNLKKFRSYLYKFPYKQFPDEFKFNFRSERKKETQSTLWHAFIDQVMERRHKVAHGDTLENETTHENLRNDIYKIEVLMHGLLYACAQYITKNLK